MGKKITAKRYMESVVVFDREDKCHYLVKDEDGYLFVRSRHKTKIKKEDLPEWYIHGYMGGGRHGFVSAKGVKHLVYKPNYFSNHLHKDDFLYISYNDEIVPYTDEYDFSWFKGYDELVHGALIPAFVDAAEKYSGYDVSEIMKEIEKKREWFYERNPDWRKP